LIQGFPTRSLAVSSDGTQLVYVSRNVEAQRRQLQLRSLATLAVRDLPGTEGAAQPFFSPDGRWVGFFTESGELKKVSLGRKPGHAVDKDRR
jgi:serine/threonine-protein kinase